ncbi:unnamed protein product, partial [Polarella glacialis]
MGTQELIVELSGKSVRELQGILDSCGLERKRSYLEKTELVSHAAEAERKKRAGACSGNNRVSPRTSQTKKSRLESSKAASGTPGSRANDRAFDRRASDGADVRRGQRKSDTKAGSASLRLTLLPQSTAELARAPVEQLRRLLGLAGSKNHAAAQVERAGLQERARQLLTSPKALPKPGPIRDRGHVAHVLTPKGLKVGESLPLLFVLHGAGRTTQSIQHMVLQFSKLASRLKCLIVVPASRDKTWDLLPLVKHGRQSDDSRFIEFVLNRVLRDYYVDSGRIGALGFSDGGSYALTLAVNNPHVFQGAMSWSAGYYFHEDSRAAPSFEWRPRILHGHGKADDLFDFSKVGSPMRKQLREAGYQVDVDTPRSAGHGTPPEFPRKAIKWLKICSAPEIVLFRVPPLGHSVPSRDSYQGPLLSGKPRLS